MLRRRRSKMRLLHSSVTATPRVASPTRRSERPKPEGKVSTTIPPPVYRQSYHASRRVAAAYCITKIPFPHGAPARGAFIQNFKWIAATSFGTSQEAKAVQEQGMITNVATLQPVPLRRYPAASTILDAELNAQDTPEYSMTAGLSIFGNCSVATRESNVEQTAVVPQSSSGLEQLRRSLARIQSAITDEPASMQQSSSSEGEDTYEEVRLKLAQHRTDVASSMRSLRHALENQLSGVCSTRVSTSVPALIR